MSVNIDQVIREAYDELVLRSEQDRLRAEGVVYLSHKLAQAMSVASTEATGEPSTSQDVPDHVLVMDSEVSQGDQ